MFAFGARDELDTPAATAEPGAPSPPLTPTLDLGFHRVDLRLHHAPWGRLEETFRAVLGYDRTFSNGTDFWVWGVEPSVTAEWTQSERLRIAEQGPRLIPRPPARARPPWATQIAFSAITSTARPSVYVGVVVSRRPSGGPRPSLLIRPGLRADLYEDNTATKAAADPRLTARYRLLDRHLARDRDPGSDDRAVFLKASAGIYHQPPRFVLPLPGLDLMPLQVRLAALVPDELGRRHPAARQDRNSPSIEGFFNYMDPTIFDLSINTASVVNSANQMVAPIGVVMPKMDGQEFIDRLTSPETGRAYGLELMLRRRSKTGVFGWISYTLSRSELRYLSPGRPHHGLSRWLGRLRLRSHSPLQPRGGAAAAPELGPRRAPAVSEAGARVTVTTGYNGAYGDGYFRFDFRIDKRAVYRKWLLDFYVDVTNAALFPEEVEPGTVIRYVLPTVGLRGRL